MYKYIYVYIICVGAARMANPRFTGLGMDGNDGKKINPGFPLGLGFRV